MPILFNFSEPDTGLFVRGAYAVTSVKRLAESSVIDIQIKIYNSAADVAKTPLSVYSYIINSQHPRWDAYFNRITMNQSGKSIYDQIDKLVLTLDGTQQGSTNGINFSGGIIV